MGVGGGIGGFGVGYRGRGGGCLLVGFIEGQRVKEMVAYSSKGMIGKFVCTMNVKLL